MDYSKLSDESIKLLLVEKLKNSIISHEMIESQEQQLQSIYQTIEKFKKLNKISDDQYNNIKSQLEVAKRTSNVLVPDHVITDIQAKVTDAVKDIFRRKDINSKDTTLKDAVIIDMEVINQKKLNKK